MSTCKLKLHPTKTKIVNLRGRATERYPRKYDFLGFTIKPCHRIIQGKGKVMPGTFVSTASKVRITEKFRKLNIHKWRKPIEEVAQALNPVIRGVLNYYQAFWDGGMRKVWDQLNHRLLKWVKWEKGLYKRASVRWLQGQYRQNPNLFTHWKLVHP